MQRKKLCALGLATAACCAGLAAVAATPASSAAPAPVSRAADFTGYQLVKLPNANVPNFARRTVRCPSGKRAVGGGAEAQGNDAILVGSFPTDDGTGWIGLGRQNNYSDVGISVYVICANVS
ncbi:hypothetical protein ABGB17_26980 [Sphaerisporangium sp. B11E5]|uniref:hypothetical protein n=1 Tax=Sphaerisporangium sp. B11E5 TaxID=3153563 RepID=UPI00325DBDC0